MGDEMAISTQQRRAGEGGAPVISAETLLRASYWMLKRGAHASCEHRLASCPTICSVQRSSRQDAANSTLEARTPRQGPGWQSRVSFEEGIKKPSNILRNR